MFFMEFNTGFLVSVSFFFCFKFRLKLILLPVEYFWRYLKNIYFSYTDGPQTVNLSSKTDNFTIGNSLLLTCVTSCNPSCSYEWLKNDRQIPWAPNRMTFFRQILEQTDEGQYKCRVGNEIRDATSMGLNVTVQGKIYQLIVNVILYTIMT